MNRLLVPSEDDRTMSLREVDRMRADWEAIRANSVAASDTSIRERALSRIDTRHWVALDGAVDAEKRCGALMALAAAASIAPSPDPIDSVSTQFLIAALAVGASLESRLRALCELASSFSTGPLDSRVLAVEMLSVLIETAEMESHARIDAIRLLDELANDPALEAIAFARLARGYESIRPYQNRPGTDSLARYQASTSLAERAIRRGGRDLALQWVGRAEQDLMIAPFTCGLGFQFQESQLAELRARASALPEAAP